MLEGPCFSRGSLVETETSLRILKLIQEVPIWNLILSLHSVSYLSYLYRP